MCILYNLMACGLFIGKRNKPSEKYILGGYTMESLTTALLPVVQKINAYLSDYVLIVLLLGVGLYFTFRTKFIQLRCFKEGWNLVFGNLTLKGEKQESGMSSFQALATSIASHL